MLTRGGEAADRIFPRHLHRPRFDERFIEHREAQVASQALIGCGRSFGFWRVHLPHHSAK
jgi:hypothetical protein